MPFKSFTPFRSTGAQATLWRHDSKGFTLLELIAALVLLGLLSAIFGMGLVAAMQTNAFSRTNVHLSQKAQLAMLRMSRELMELTDIEAVSNTSAGNDPFIIYRRIGPGNTQLPERYGMHYDPGTQNIYLYTDLNPAVSVLDNSTTAGGDVLIDNVRNLALTYYQSPQDTDPNGSWTFGTQDLKQLSSIKVELFLNRPDDPLNTQDFSTVVHLRNNDNHGGAPPGNLPATRFEYNCFITSLMVKP